MAGVVTRGGEKSFRGVEQNGHKARVLGNMEVRWSVTWEGGNQKFREIPLLGPKKRAGWAKLKESPSPKTEPSLERMSE